MSTSQPPGVDSVLIIDFIAKSNEAVQFLPKVAKNRPVGAIKNI